MSKVFEALAALAAVGTFIVTFLDSYEIQVQDSEARADCARRKGAASATPQQKIRPGVAAPALAT